MQMPMHIEIMSDSSAAECKSVSNCLIDEGVHAFGIDV